MPISYYFGSKITTSDKMFGQEFYRKVNEYLHHGGKEQQEIGVTQWYDFQLFISSRLGYFVVY